MNPPPVTPDILITAAITLGALVLFVLDRLPIEVVGLMVMVALVLTGVVTPAEGVSGFASEAIVTIAAMFVLSAALVRTGGVDVLGRFISKLAGDSEFRLLAMSLAVVVPASAFVNNTPVVVVMVPVLLGLARERGVPASRLFMPMSFASQMGGTLTLIGTSTNLLVAGLVLDLGLPRIELFDITPPALVLTALGVLYLLTVGRKLVPDRDGEEDLEERYELGEYLSGLEVGEESDLAGRSLEESGLREKHGLDVLAIERDEERIFLPDGFVEIREGDRLVVRGKITGIADAESGAGLRISGTGSTFSSPELDADEGESRYSELLVPPRSRVVGASLEELRFRGRYGVPVVGIRRHGEAVHEPMRSVSLHAGDILLVRATPRDLERIRDVGDLALLGPLDLPPRRKHKLPHSVAVILTVVLLAALGVTTILVAALAGVVAVFLAGCLTPEEAYEDIDWKPLVLLGSILPLGIAMQQTGAAELSAAHFLTLTRTLGPTGVLVAFYVFTSLLTELISNAASAVVLTPLAVAMGQSLDVSPMPFVVAVILAASNSFITPVGYQTNTFIFGPGGYRFSDFLRVGGPLSLLFAAAAGFVIPAFFPF
ncbi:MAG: SLC13 family permease [Gemmatimonadota bacterium]|nr:SLC13 family permease [Gemmatimonadota bacterium]